MKGKIFILKSYASNYFVLKNIKIKNKLVLFSLKMINLSVLLGWK